MTRGHLDVHVKVETAGASSALLSVAQRLAEPHRPRVRPYADAPGFQLAQCPVCGDGSRWRVQLSSEVPVACGVWAGVVAG